MKNILLTSLVALSLSLNLNAADKSKTIVVGATPVPHAEILEVIKPILAKDGYTLEIKEFNDYSIPNLATDDGELDANFFQHLPYLNEFNKNKGTKLIKSVGVHLEPMGVYSKKIKSINELKNGDSVAIPNDPTNESRALDVLATAGLIKLNDNPLKTPLDIVENSKNLKFSEIETAQLPRTLDDVTIAIINTNYALNASLNPTKDALVLESKDSPYVNYVVVKVGNEDSAKIKALSKAITSDEVKEFINKKYEGAILPAF
ncbi:MetQ/NlpA family ABC transporter substrate-binding protein [Campylobacter sp. faydin G-24]|uniref:MetQ/NlpA family ABC transporter substrate-binding protein n=1 Tax=Campylobacter anatolicus TaxID=2829105 RepID=A0ABS5HHY6_9BACT|nr:MetQ/NlpA family ABC transporter substrate-binding protein [Campylobacter anatolicus]MBR8462815.1 MetQ/NlpA family ABC transporter substrate-binding protein [Campylobacter anatolicus]MBR8463889.1 MetQ/NlpA family ABC transporter substrate-binding protein [Campylobacter anatolicus]